MKSIRFWSWLLALLGFAAAGCSGDPYGGEPEPPLIEPPTPDTTPLMYGSPYATFSVKARVVDAQNAPLAGMLTAGVYSSSVGQFDKGQLNNAKPAKTNAEGVATGQWEVVRWDSVFLYVYDPAGKYADTLCRYKVDAVKEIDQSKKDFWYWGQINKEVEVVLRKK